jgi:RES domain-containing protein
MHAAFDGEGARRFGGRWNLRGTAVVYTSATASLAALEYLVNLEPEDAPADLVLVPADVPASLAVEEVQLETLAADWRSVPAPQSLARLGTEWARAQSTAVLSLPSAVLPFERNYLLNPGHRSFVSIVVGRPRPFTLDPRLWKVRPSQT